MLLGRRADTQRARFPPYVQACCHALRAATQTTRRVALPMMKRKSDWHGREERLSEGEWAGITLPRRRYSCPKIP